MKRRYRVILLVIALISTFYLFRPHYFVRTSVDKNVNLLWKGDTAYIFIGERIEGARGSYCGLALNSFLGIWGHSSDDYADSLMVVEIRGKTINSCEINNLSFRGSAVPVDGSIYYGVGTTEENWPAMWKWNGSTFVKLDRTTATRIANSYRYDTDQIVKEGWKHAELFLSGALVSSEFVVNGINYRVVLKTDGTAESKERSVSLQKEGAQPEITELIKKRGQFEAVNRRSYRSYFEIRNP